MVCGGGAVCELRRGRRRAGEGMYVNVDSGGAGTGPGGERDLAIAGCSPSS